MKKKIKWQSYSYTFPQTAYCVYLYVKDPNDGKGFWYSWDELVTEVAYAASIPSLFNRTVEKYKQVSRSELEPYLLEVHLDHLIPHTKEMWKPSTVEYSPTNRHQSFYELIVEPTWYNVLVVPRYVNKGKEFFDVAVPIKATVTDEELPVIMQGLQFPVDEKSTHSALYRPGNFFLLNERLEFEGVNWPSDEANLGLLN